MSPRGEPSLNLPQVNLNQDETIQDTLDLDKELLQSPSQPFLPVEDPCQSLQVSSFSDATSIQNFYPLTIEF